jgi:2,3-bisphosphoglycerate-dependent phosphoglycerate mutase
MKTNKIIYFVRHGESEANRKSMFQAPDDTVTERGHAQNVEIGKRFAHVEFDLLLSSSFERAQATAQEISKHTGKDIVTSDLWREYVPPTSLLGKARSSNEGIEYMKARKEHMHDPQWHFEDEENYYDLHKRADVALADLMERPDKTIVVVTHLGFLKAIMTHMLMHGEPDPRIYVNIRFFFEAKNAGMTICRYGTDKKNRSGWRLVTWNDYTHLSPELATLTEAFNVV